MYDIDSFIAFCKPLEGRTFAAIGGRAEFQLFAVQSNKLVYKVSTGKTRDHTRKRIGMVLDRYRETKSLRPKDYKGISFNLSFVLPLVKLYSQHCESEGNVKP